MRTHSPESVGAASASNQSPSSTPELYAARLPIQILRSFMSMSPRQWEAPAGWECQSQRPGSARFRRGSVAVVGEVPRGRHVAPRRLAEVGAVGIGGVAGMWPDRADDVGDGLQKISRRTPLGGRAEQGRDGVYGLLVGGDCRLLVHVHVPSSMAGIVRRGMPSHTTRTSVRVSPITLSLTANRKACRLARTATPRRIRHGGIQSTR